MAHDPEDFPYVAVDLDTMKLFRADDGREISVITLIATYNGLIKEFIHGKFAKGGVIKPGWATNRNDDSVPVIFQNCNLANKAETGRIIAECLNAYHNKGGRLP